MPSTLEQTNGHGAAPHPTPSEGGGGTRGGTSPGGRVLPDNTKVDVDLSHRQMIEDWAGWYYPGLKPKDRPALDVILAEMIEVAHGVGEDDPQRPETPAERKARLKGGRK